MPCDCMRKKNKDLKSTYYIVLSIQEEFTRTHIFMAPSWLKWYSKAKLMLLPTNQCVNFSPRFFPIPSGVHYSRRSSINNSLKPLAFFSIFKHFLFVYNKVLLGGPGSLNLYCPSWPFIHNLSTLASKILGLQACLPLKLLSLKYKLFYLEHHFISCFFFPMWCWIELKTLHMLGKPPTTETYSQPSFFHL